MVKDFLRRHSLKKDASKEPTGLLPLQAVRSAVAFISVEEADFDACKNAMMAYFRDKGIKADIFFFDFRKIAKGERLITSITTTVLKKDLNWYGRPSREKTALVLDGDPDLLLSLLPEAHYPLEYLARCSKARFKIGREQLSGNLFDLVLKDPAGKALSQKEAFEEIVKLLEKIR